MASCVKHNNSYPHAGKELASLIIAKYGKKYDLAIARRSFAGKDFVSLNVMWCDPLFLHPGKRVLLQAFTPTLLLHTACMGQSVSTYISEVTHHLGSVFLYNPVQYISIEAGAKMVLTLPDSCVQGPCRSAQLSNV